MSDTDQLVRDYVLYQFKRSSFWKPPDTYTHLKTCPDVAVTVTDQYTGAYGCETGCDAARIEADITCGHGVVYEYEARGTSRPSRRHSQVGTVEDLNSVPRITGRLPQWFRPDVNSGRAAGSRSDRTNAHTPY